MTKEEARLYSLGYQAGVKFQKKNTREKQLHEFKKEAFLAVLPFCMEAQGWKWGEVEIKDADQKIDFAWILAEKACKKM